MNTSAQRASLDIDDSDSKHKVIVAVADELASLNEKNVALQGLIAPLLKSNLLTLDHLVEVQNADIISQHLAELSKFLASYVKLCEAGETNSAMAAINDVVLSALAERLALRCLGSEAAVQTGPNVEFF